MPFHLMFCTVTSAMVTPLQSRMAINSPCSAPMPSIMTLFRSPEALRRVMRSVVISKKRGIL